MTTVQPVSDQVLKERRQLAGQLLQQVLDETLTAKQGICRWPLLPEGCLEEPDPSLRSAYQALWHFESDEDQQQQEVFYMDLQLELLKQMSQYLRQGNALPHHLAAPYLNTHVPQFYQPKGLLQKVWQEALGWLYARYLQMNSILKTGLSSRHSKGLEQGKKPGGERR